MPGLDETASGAADVNSKGDQGALDGAEGAEEEPLDHDPEVEVVPETGAAECEDSKNVD